MKIRRNNNRTAVGSGVFFSVHPDEASLAPVSAGSRALSGGAFVPPTACAKVAKSAKPAKKNQNLIKSV